jgi:hypothetical protein
MSDDSKDAGAPVITPEMIEAGRLILLREISVWFRPDYDLAKVVEKVFRAMIRASRSSC